MSSLFPTICGILASNLAAYCTWAKTQKGKFLPGTSKQPEHADGDGTFKFEWERSFASSHSCDFHLLCPNQETNCEIPVGSCKVPTTTPIHCKLLLAHPQKASQKLQKFCSFVSKFQRNCSKSTSDFTQNLHPKIQLHTIVVAFRGNSTEFFETHDRFPTQMQANSTEIIKTHERAHSQLDSENITTIHSEFRQPDKP